MEKIDTKANSWQRKLLCRSHHKYSYLVWLDRDNRKKKTFGSSHCIKRYWSVMMLVYAAIATADATAKGYYCWHPSELPYTISTCQAPASGGKCRELSTKRCEKLCQANATTNWPSSRYFVPTFQFCYIANAMQFKNYVHILHAGKWGQFRQKEKRRTKLKNHAKAELVQQQCTRAQSFVPPRWCNVKALRWLL